jgi:hypothetical protein
VEPEVPAWGEKPWHVVQDSVRNFERHVLAVLRGEAEPQPSGADNLRTLALCLAAYDSPQPGGACAVTDRIEADYLIETAEDPARAAEVMAGEQSSGTFVAVPGGRQRRACGWPARWWSGWRSWGESSARPCPARPLAAPFLARATLSWPVSTWARRSPTCLATWQATSSSCAPSPAQAPRPPTARDLRAANPAPPSAWRARRLPAVPGR